MVSKKKIFTVGGVSAAALAAFALYYTQPTTDDCLKDFRVKALHDKNKAGGPAWAVPAGSYETQQALKNCLERAGRPWYAPF